MNVEMFQSQHRTVSQLANSSVKTTDEDRLLIICISLIVLHLYAFYETLDRHICDLPPQNHSDVVYHSLSFQ